MHSDNPWLFPALPVLTTLAFGHQALPRTARAWMEINFQG
ncbi:hypothetical protein JOC76_003359 [Neobacillus cucumis]|nr:hypothetical protein [Neobacillus cucumis]